MDLGSLHLELGSAPVPVSRRLASILSALLLNLGARVSVERLLDATWGDRSASVGTLETHIWRLRRLLEPEGSRTRGFTVLVADNGGFRLQAEPAQVDSARFGQLGLEVVDLLATQQYERALDAADRALVLWRGEPYAALADCDWATAPIARLTELSMQLRERRIDTLLGLGRTEQALAEVVGLLGDHPFRERLWTQKMLALHRSGRSEEALRSFLQARALLLEQVGVEPGSELRRLQQQILSGDPALRPRARPTAKPARPVPLRLPRRITLIGREADRQKVGRSLRPGGLTTICGPAGCGKTRLAVEVAARAAKAYPDGVYFVDLSGANEQSDVIGLVAEALGVNPAATSVPSSLRAFAEDRRLLLVVDNCEQVIESVRTLCDLVVDDGLQFAVLATSREPLDLAEEFAYRLDPLPVGSAPRAGDSSLAPAVALFVRLARLHDPDLATLVQVWQICRAVDGLPLAVELAAALHPPFALSEIRDQVEVDPSQLSAIGHGQAQHHRTLLVAIDRSYQRLSTPDQRVHRALSVLAAPFSADLAGSVMDRLGHGDALRTSLARLTRRSMLMATQSDGGRTMFAQLAAVRAHAAAGLATLRERQATEQARDAWLDDLLDRRPALGRPEEADWHARLATDLPVVRTVLQHRLNGVPAPVGWRAVGGLTALWYLRGLVDEGLRWAELAAARSTEVAAALSNLDDVRAGLALASLAALRGDHRRAMTVYRTVLGRAAPETLRHPRTVDALLGLSSALALSDYGSMRVVLADAANGVAAIGQGDFDVKLAALEVMAGAPERPVDITREAAELSYEAALAQGNLMAAWWSCSSVNGCALRTRDARSGLLWSRRMLELLLRIGMTAPLPQVETYGIFLALSGRWPAAVEVFAARYREARRQNVDWPRQPLTMEMLAAAREQLSRSAFDEAWAVGPMKPISDLLID